MSAPILLVHGWGFDATIWDAVAARLPDRTVLRAEAGYLGAEPHWPVVPAGTIAVGHSAGALSLLRSWPEACAALVSIAGFTRFAAADAFPGVPARVLDRMARQFDADPRSTLDAFRTRCGARAAGATVPERLAEGLRALRKGDGRVVAARLFGGASDGAEDRAFARRCDNGSAVGQHPARYSSADALDCGDGTIGAPADAFPPQTALMAGCNTAGSSPGPSSAGRNAEQPPFDAGLVLQTGLPLLALAATDDPIVVPAHSRACFAPDALHWSNDGGHLLPLTRPDWCAAMIRSVCV